MQPLAAARTLDVDGAISSAAAAGLARGLVQAAAVLLIIGVIGAALVRPRVAAGPGLVRRVPWRGVLTGASIVLAIGGLIGIWASTRNSSIVSGEGFGEAARGGIATWSIAAIVLAATALAVSLRGRVLMGGTCIAAVVVLLGVSMTSELPRPEKQVQTTAEVSGTVQATIVVTPGAAGANDVRLGLSGPDKDVEQLRAAAADGDATVSFRSLALGVTTPGSPLSLDDEGALVASDVVLDGDGRWRAQFEVAGLDAPIVADITMQPNPGHDA